MPSQLLTDKDNAIIPFLKVKHAQSTCFPMMVANIVQYLYITYFETDAVHYHTEDRPFR